MHKEQNIYLFICFLEVFFIHKLQLEIEFVVKTFGKFGLFSQQTFSFIRKVSSLKFCFDSHSP